MSLTLKASVYTLAGELVGSIRGLAGTNEVIWDASGTPRGDAGVVSGLYLAVVEQVDSKGGPVSRQIQKLAVLH